MYEISEALQQMLDRSNNQVAQEVQSQQQTSQLTFIGERSSPTAPWEITWKTSA